MPYGLKRYHESRDTHFLTFSCYRRLRFMTNPSICDLFLHTLEECRTKFGLRIYAYVLMPEHVHLLLSEPERRLLADAMHWLKLTFAKRARSAGLRPSNTEHFWQKRYYDHNVFSHEKFEEKLHYIHRNPVKRGLCAKAEDWRWSSFRHYAEFEIGPVEIESDLTARKRELAGMEKTHVNG